MTRAQAAVATLLPAVLASVVFFPLTLFLYPALGKTSLIVIAVIASVQNVANETNGLWATVRENVAAVM